MSKSFVKRADFGKDFYWGVSASALQTEGALKAGGRGESIWDNFKPSGFNFSSVDEPSVACDFYHRYQQDIDLIKNLGIPHFRFSIAWPRILPEGTGEVNQEGLQFYHELIDYCLAQGIEPWLTLYHWDLPKTLQDKGGWTNRAILKWFEQYVSICVKAFGHKVKHWMVLNEPMVFTGAGYFLGAHAPGKKGLSQFLPAMHHAVLCQSIGFKTVKKYAPQSRVGSTFSCSYITPYSLKVKDKTAAVKMHALLNRLFIEPALGMGYPLEDLPVLKKVKKYMLPGDEDLMKVDFDFIGIQNYTREVVKHTYFIPFLNAKIIPASKRKVYHTGMNWEVHPESIYEMVKFYSHYEKVKEIIITENGASFQDEVRVNKVEDTERVIFLKTYIAEALRAKKTYPKLKGYFVWSITDNFEWAEGFKQRFGLVYVNFHSQRRVIKNSGYWYQAFLSES